MPDLKFLTDNWDKLLKLGVPAALAAYGAIRRWLTARAARKSTTPPALAPAPTLPPPDPREVRLAARVKSPYFANQPDGETCILENALLLLSARPLSNNMSYLVHPLDCAARARRPLVIIAPDVTGEALATLIKNFRLGVLVCCAVAIGHLPDADRKLRELKKKTGATIFGDEAWVSMSEFTPSDYGLLSRIEAGPESVVLLVPEQLPNAQTPAAPPTRATG